MIAIIEFPDPEALVVGYLAAQLPEHGIALPVGTSVPRDAAGRSVDEYIRVLILGGSQRDTVIDEVLVAVESHHGIDGDSVEASRIAGVIRGLLMTMPLHVPAVRRVREVGRPVPRTHPETGAPSYSQSHQLTTRGI